MRPSLRTIVRRALRAPTPPTLLVAVSGGPDSMALLDVLGSLGPKLGLSVLAHGVDHGLRPEAARELDLAEGYARSAGIEFSRTALSLGRGGNLQERARLARWAALVTIARRTGAAIATGHHADDRAETVLLRVLRGSGLRGLAAMPERGVAVGAPDVTVLRPMLQARRLDIVTHIERHQVPFASDPSNEDPRHLRVRVRRELLPLLESLDPRIVEHLGHLAEEAAAGEAAPSAERNWTAGLPRQTQEALRSLVRTRSPSARVWLPGGLVAMTTEDAGRAPGARPEDPSRKAQERPARANRNE